MTTTQRPPTRSKPQRYDPVPAHMRKWRTALTILAVLMVGAGLFMLAVELGQGDSLIWPGVLAVIGVALAVTAQRPGLYQWAERPPKIRKRELKAPVVSHADHVPVARQPRRRARPQPDPDIVVPALLPDASLGPDLRYLVRYVRHLVANDMGAHIEALTGMWEDNNWDPDLDPDSDDYTDYRHAVETALWLVEQHPAYDDSVDLQQVLDGSADPRNPLAFISEMDAVTPIAGAVGVLLAAHLVPAFAENGEGLDDVIMQPWRELLLPYRLGDNLYEYDSNTGDYAVRQVGMPSPARPAATLDDVMRERGIRSAKSEPVAPQQQGHAPVAKPTEPTPAPVAQPAQAGQVPASRDVELVVKAAELIVYSQFGSTAMLQRKLRLGFADAGHVVDVLVTLAVLGPERGQAGRPVLATPDEWPDVEKFIRGEFAAGRV